MAPKIRPAPCVLRYEAVTSRDIMDVMHAGRTMETEA